MLILEKEKHKNLNIKAAYLHLLGDALTSLAVIAGAVLIWFFNVLWVDSAVTILISIYLFVHTLKLLKQSVNILMQMAPADFNCTKIEQSLLNISEIRNIHHIHVWSLTDKIVHFECHVLLKNDLNVSETNQIFEAARKILQDDFNIEHVTIQFEFEPAFGENCAC